MKHFILAVSALFLLMGTATAQTKNQRKMNKALIIVDIQNDYFKGGKMTLHHAEEAGENARLILEKSRREGIPVIHVQHIALQPDATFFLPNTAGVEIHQSVRPAKGEKLIVKHYPNSFRETDLLDCLHQMHITDLVVVGMMTHVCIDATVKAAKDYGFNCSVISDACATRDLNVSGETVKADQVQLALLGAMNFYYSDIKTTREYLEGK